MCGMSRGQPEVCNYWKGTVQLRVGFEIRGHSVTTHEQLNSGSIFACFQGA